MIAGRLEARIDIDADGFLMQRGPVAELKLGACDPLDAGRAEWLAHLLAGRGIKTRVEPQIGDAIWERYAFTAAAVAINTISGSSLRDAIRPTNTITSFDRLMAEGTDVGQKIGLRPRPEQVISYRKAFRLQTRPVQPPALITDGGARADEAAYLLIEMVEIATRASVFETQQRERSANADARQIPHHIVRMEASEDLAMVLLGIRLGRGRTKPLPGRKRPKHPVSRRMPARRAARDTDPDDFVRQLR